jgi:hypothetical protein
MSVTVKITGNKNIFSKDSSVQESVYVSVDVQDITRIDQIKNEIEGFILTIHDKYFTFKEELPKQKTSL